MTSPIRPIPRGRFATHVMATALVGVAGFGLGAWAIGSAKGGAGDPAPGNREVSQKVWVTAQELNERFTPEQSREFMRRAIANSRKAGVEKRTGGAFGAVIVDRQGKIIAEGSNHVVANFDPTWHGEMEAIRNACGSLKLLKLDGCVLYTSSEPCPMCLATAYWAGLDGIVYGATVDDAKKYGGFDDAFIYEQFALPTSERKIPELTILRDEAVKVWKEYAAQQDNVAY